MAYTIYNNFKKEFFKQSKRIINQKKNIKKANTRFVTKKQIV